MVVYNEAFHTTEQHSSVGTHIRLYFIEHHNGSDVEIFHQSPEIDSSVRQWHLSHDELLSGTVAL